MISQQMSSTTLWGLTGVSLARIREAQYVKDLVPAASWYSCGGPVTAGCLSKATPLSLINRANPASLCGSVVFVSALPELHVGMRPDAKVAVLDLACAT